MTRNTVRNDDRIFGVGHSSYSDIEIKVGVEETIYVGTEKGVEVLARL